MPCPNCGKKVAGRQHPLTPTKQSQLTAKAAAVAASRGAQRCHNCGLIYTAGLPIERLGWLDGVMGRGFKPALDYDT